jgi:hypothetical protein
MLKNKINQSGEAVAIILLIIVVAVVGGLFYWKYQQVNKEVGKVDTSVPKASEKSSPQTDLTEYLTIKEWGVKFPIDGTLDDLYYSFTKAENGHENTYFAEKNIVNKYPDCAPDRTARFAIGRYIKGDTVNDIPIENIQGVVKINDYYYLYSGPQATCAFNKSTNKDDDETLIANGEMAGGEEYLNAYKKLQLAD